MAKSIVIIGGGISGLAVLHNLKMKYGNREDINVRLLEKNEYLGGTIRTLHEGGCLFETGPNGFLDSKEIMRAFIRELGVEAELLPVNPEAEKRFIARGDRLYRLPANPVDFLGFPLLSVRAKLRVMAEPFVPKGKDAGESVHDFGQRRLGKEFANVLLDPMVNGIFAGDTRQLNLKTAFPRIFELEQRYGSLLKGMAVLGKEKRGSRKKGGQPAGRLMSFSGGMSRLIKILHDRYEGVILTGQEVVDLTRQGTQMEVRTGTQSFLADELFVSTPAYQAEELLRNFSPGLAARLSRITYVPVVVAGLVYKRDTFANVPEGFGYLVPSSENTEVLGVLFSSNIFEGRSRPDEFLFRVMIGGSRYPGITGKTRDQLFELAEAEVGRKFTPRHRPAQTFIAVWPRAIPQYNQDYPRVCEEIAEELQQTPGLRLVANYLGGISLNDCVASAKRAVDQSHF